jgi:hypothetical protein
MADIARECNEIILKLSAGERIMAVHRDVRVPLSAVKGADVDPPNPRAEAAQSQDSRWILAGLVRVRILLRRGRAPAAVRCCERPKPRGLEITLGGARYTRLIVSLDHPDAAKRALAAKSGSTAGQHPQFGM